MVNLVALMMKIVLWEGKEEIILVLLVQEEVDLRGLLLADVVAATVTGNA